MGLIRHRNRLEGLRQWFVGRVERLKLSQYGLIFSTRTQEAKGATVASAGAITLGSDGNTFTISGTTTVNHITKTNWQAGAKLKLIFSGILQLTHNAGTVPATAAAVKLMGAANWTTAANDSIVLTFDGTDWREESRAPIAGLPSTLIPANSIDNTDLRQSAALSVVGNSTNATANVADIAAASDFHVLRRSGTAVGFGTVVTGGIAVKGVNFTNANAFVSTEQTGTGSSQNVAHGLTGTPSAVLITVTELPDAAAETGFDVAEGAHDGTNVVVTITNTVKFKVLAWI